MLKYILLILGLMLAWAYPWLLLLAGLYLLWKMLDIDKDIRKLKKCGVDPIQEKPTRIHREDQVEKNFEPGFRDDPEWQARSAAIRNHINANKKVNHIELSDDKYERIPPYWAKKR